MKKTPLGTEGIPPGTYKHKTFYFIVIYNYKLINLYVFLAIYKTNKYQNSQSDRNFQDLCMRKAF